MINNCARPWHAARYFTGMLLATHTLLFRVHTRVFLTLGIALATVATFLASLLTLAT